MLATMRQTAQLVEFFHRRGLKTIYDKNQYIIHGGEPPSGVFYIVTGLVKASDFTRYNEENLLIIRKEHEVFPLIWAVTGQERHVAYQALTPATLLRVDRGAFVEFIRQNPEALAPLMDMTIEMYRLHSERILNLEYRTVRERLASFLLTMAQRFGQPLDGGGVRIEAPLRHQDIASSINATRETTTRELRLLHRRGLVTKTDQNFILPAPATLQGLLTRAQPSPPSANAK